MDDLERGVRNRAFKLDAHRGRRDSFDSNQEVVHVFTSEILLHIRWMGELKTSLIGF